MKLKTIAKKDYEKELELLSLELVKLQQWVKYKNLKVAVLFEGRDAAGKGGVIKRITEPLNPRVCRICALGIPTEKEKTQWYFQRYVEHLPSAGEIVLFDRSWYNRAGVEKVMGYCNEDEYNEFLRSCPQFEEMLIKSGIILIKYWFSVSASEQEKRFKDRLSSPLTSWKFSPIDEISRSKWVEYSRAKDLMFERTNTVHSPWHEVAGDNKKSARLSCITHLLSQIKYEEVPHQNITFTERHIDESEYIRPDQKNNNMIPMIELI